MTNVGVVIVKPISENWFSEMRLYVPYRGLRVWTACSLDSACLGLCQQVLPLWFPKKSLFVRRGSAFFFVFCVFRVFVTRSVFCPGFRFARRRVLWVFFVFFLLKRHERLRSTNEQRTNGENCRKTNGVRKSEAIEAAQCMKDTANSSLEASSQIRWRKTGREGRKTTTSEIHSRKE